MNDDMLDLDDVLEAVDDEAHARAVAAQSAAPEAIASTTKKHANAKLSQGEKVAAAMRLRDGETLEDVAADLDVDVAYLKRATRALARLIVM